MQAAHIGDLHRHFAFRRALYHALAESGATVQSGKWIELADIGVSLFETMQRHGALPDFRRDQSRFRQDKQSQTRYQQYLQFVTLRELRGTARYTHQNLEDAGLLAVGYNGLAECAADDSFWADAPILADLDADERYDLLLGFLDLMRKRLAIAHDAALRPGSFRNEVLDHLNDQVFIHDEEFDGPIGYSAPAVRGYGYTVYPLTGSRTQTTVWLRRALQIDPPTATELAQRIVDKLGHPDAGFLVRHTVHGQNHVPYELWMLNPDVLTLQADDTPVQWSCPRCLTVQRFRRLRVCNGSACQAKLQERDLADNYFRQVYQLAPREAVQVRAEEHSGQVSGADRRDIELRFRDAADPLNVLICTPTMELGIDIGHLNAVMLRNVPPSPSHYAQRAGRAGRSGQPSLITVFAGVGSARGPHDQYFYRFPERMISGAIAVPRFRLDNRDLVRAHIHSLVLEIMGLKGAQKLAGKPKDLLNLAIAGFPLYADWESAYRMGVSRCATEIVQAVMEAFAEEIKCYDWLNRAFIEQIVHDFVDDLDAAMTRWRTEYQRLDEEWEKASQQLRHENVDPSLQRRRAVVEVKLQTMRDGGGDWYLYRYLGGEGFLPGYAFPPRATMLSFDDREDELARDPGIALVEYAPGNFVYYRGQRYEITHARPRTRQMELDVQSVLVCPICQQAYLGAQETHRAVCHCGQDLSARHPQKALALCDMYAQRRARINAEEEERLRLGYEVTYQYMAGGRRTGYQVCAREGSGFQLTLEHDGQVLLLNRGARKQGEDPKGFILCRKCHRWLLADKEEEKHITTPQRRGDCPRGAAADDLVGGLQLLQTLQSDLALLDVPLPQGADPDSFYTTLLHSWLRALMVAFNLDESELGGFLAPGPNSEQPRRLVLYETPVGGSGVLASLAEVGRLQKVVARARELLHEGETEDGCERACYECLLSFYNQRDHAILDRRLVLPWLCSLEQLRIETPGTQGGASIDRLEAQCQSDLERAFLRAAQTRGLPLPDAAQKTIYDSDEPIAISDFYYDPKLLVFVDGSPHYLDYVIASDERKRLRLKAKGYRIIAIKGDQLDQGLSELARLLGVR